MAVKILGTGGYLPPRVVTNDELAKSLDTSDEWIFSHSGIHSRHIAGPDENTSSMARQRSCPPAIREYPIIPSLLPDPALPLDVV